MKTIVVNRDSWHYKLAHFLDKDYCPRRADFCAYLRGILKSVVGIAFLCAMACGAIYLVAFAFWGLGELIAWLIFGLLHGWMPMESNGFIGALIVFIGTVCGGIALAQKAGPVIVEKQPAFIKTAWQSIHEKTCFRLKAE